MNKHGFTLVEVVISALILTFAVGGLLFVFSTEKGVVSRTGRKTQAMDFARQTLEGLKNDVNALTWPNAGNLGTVGTDITVGLPSSELRDKFGGTRHYRVTNINADGDAAYEDDEYKQVTVTIDWTEPSE